MDIVNATEIIRRIEADILDQKYKQFSLLRRRRDLAIGHLMKMFGDVVRDLASGAVVNNFQAASSQVNLFVSGIGHCLRWILNDGISKVVLPDESIDTLNEEAMALLMWGRKYALLANDYTAWSRGLIEATVDEQQRRITFHLPRDANPWMFVQQMEAQQNTIDDRIKTRPDDVLRTDFSEWCKSIGCNSQPAPIQLGCIARFAQLQCGVGGIFANRH